MLTDEASGSINMFGIQRQTEHVLMSVREVCKSEEASPLLLSHPPVDGNGREVLFHQELGQSDAALN